ncbi:uncharacterized protein LOC133293436 [Gastrolobium bilobum]|uniref:uncharacterized protein LOC133293436 n=1 Tax=Gastrolobium bilobum TaxID=150636 RepID=UPI002AB20357|nr:uncharacterized protein LOC133293436 [Gastrolobium bilobum]
MAENTRLCDVTQQIQDLQQSRQAVQEQLSNLELAQDRRFTTMELSHNQRMDTLQKHMQDVLTILHSSPSFTDPHTGVLGSGPSHSGSNNTHEPNRQRQMKLDFPRFAGGEPTDWIFAVERYFRFYNVPPHERLLVVSFNLDPPASSWFQSLDQDGLLPDWNTFVTALHRRFGPTQFEDPSVLSRKITGLSVTVKKGLFLAGLKSTIRCSVLVHRPQDVHDALAYAKVYEEKLGTESIPPKHGPLKTWTPRTTSFTNQSSNQPSPPTHTFPSLPPIKQPTPISSLPICHLSLAERQARREKNLCYNCDEQFTAGHRCKGRATLLYLDGSEDATDSVPPDEDPPPEPELIPEISLNALFGHRTSNSFRLTGSISSTTVQILIDGGSTHNFITPRMASYLNLVMHAISPFNVHVGNGDILTCSASCSDIVLNMQSNSFVVDLFVLDFKGADIVLGVQWLATLGPIITDYVELTMAFTHSGNHILLKGNQLIGPTLVTSAQLHKMISHDSISSCLKCLSSTLTTPSTTQTHPTILTTPPPLSTILQEFSDVFAVPTTLPPDRNLNHHISLAPDAKPVQVRPYRYPHYQKNEIEKLISEMLAAGLIRNSQSEYSSPVLLVKKIRRYMEVLCGLQGLKCYHY